MKIENMDKFLQEIGRAPLLSKEEELALLKTVREKGSDCDEMEQLRQSSMRFVVALAAQYQHRGLKLEELRRTEKGRTDLRLRKRYSFYQICCSVDAAMLGGGCFVKN